jgi:inosine-uridine nucleoside N-ribohydrolase
MKSQILFVITILNLFLIMIFVPTLLIAQDQQPKKVIYETDMCADVDDVGGLAMLHAMADNNEVKLLAVCFNEVHPYGAPAIDAINTWYGRGEIPIGIYKGSIEDPDDSRYLEPVAQFPHDLESTRAPSALEVYQKVLRTQPDGSVTIISVGFVNNLGDLLRADPKLVASKVKELVLMAGTTDGGGFNLNRHNLSSESEYIIKDWPTPIVFTDPGGKIYTGPGLKNSPVENPVREGYYKYFKNDFKDRPSWDQISVLYGVRGLSGYFTMETTGSGHLNNGFKYQIEPGHRTFVKPLIPDDAYAGIIEDLMIRPPMKEKRVIYETNMCTSVDDVGALAMIHGLVNKGEAQLLAVCYNEVHPSGASAIDAVNTWYGRGETPVGVYKDPLPDPDDSKFLDALAKFPHDLDAKSAPSALDVYRRVLANQPDGSVTIISVGFLNNLYDLLKSEPDLVAKKVNELVIMGAVNDDALHFVAHNLVNVSQYVLENWPTPIVFHHLGGDIMTGSKLEQTPEENPVREAYYIFFDSSFREWPSYDPMTVFYGVKGYSGYFTKHATGTGSLPNGFTWDLISRNQSDIKTLLPPEAYARIIEDLMVDPPMK